MKDVDVLTTFIILGQREQVLHSESNQGRNSAEELTLQPQVEESEISLGKERLEDVPC